MNINIDKDWIVVTKLTEKNCGSSLVAQRYLEEPHDYHCASLRDILWSVLDVTIFPDKQKNLEFPTVGKDLEREVRYHISGFFAPSDEQLKKILKQNDSESWYEARELAIEEHAEQIEKESQLFVAKMNEIKNTPRNALIMGATRGNLANIISAVKEMVI